VTLDKHKVSIKINGQERSFQEETTVQDEVKKDTALAFKEIAAAQQEPNDEFDWVLPHNDVSKGSDDDRIEDFERERYVANNRSMIMSNSKVKPIRKKSKFPKTVFLAIFAALVIGTGFGMMVLQVFTTEEEEAFISNPTETITPSVQSSKTNEEKAYSAENHRNTPLITVPAFSVQLVQGGVFSSAEIAQPVLNKIKADGMAAIVISRDDKHFLFMGIGVEEEFIKELRIPYDEKGYETYVKSLTNEQKEMNITPTILDAMKLLERLMVFTSNTYLSTPQKQKWEELEKLVNSLSVEGVDEGNLFFIQSVKTSFSIVEKYHQTKELKDFWLSQQALLDSYSNYEKLIFQ
jgi:stage II sporulation protein B